MKDIRKKLKPYYQEHGSLKMEQFVLFEMAIMIVMHFESNADPNKGYILFTKYQNIGNRDISSDSFVIQNASVCLKKYRSEKIWKDTLKLYMKEEYARIRLFDIVENQFVKKDTNNMVYPNREEDYMRYITTYSSLKSNKYATQGGYKYYNKNNSLSE